MRQYRRVERVWEGQIHWIFKKPAKQYVVCNVACNVLFSSVRFRASPGHLLAPELPPVFPSRAKEMFLHVSIALPDR